LFVDPDVFNIQSCMYEQNIKLIQSLNKVFWEMYLFVPNVQRKSDILLKIVNNNIRILSFNSNMVKGIRKIRHLFYRLYLGIPSSRNVSIPAIFNMINFNYKEINLYGMDHSWISTLFVDANNQLHEDDRHFFDKEKKNILEKNVNMSKLMAGYSLVFQAHELLNDYAISRSTKIINHSQNSFIDAYQKKQ